MSSPQLSPDERTQLLQILQTRFEKHMERHIGIKWVDVQAKLEAHPTKLWSLSEMERTGGEPDVVVLSKETAEILFVDCAKESPAGRRSLCFDRAAWEKRKVAKPSGTAHDMAAEMGIELLTEDQYVQLQSVVNVDLKTSSWLQTPSAVRKLGGAIFGDRRFDRVFIYHNGADSYYAARGFRGVLKV